MSHIHTFSHMHVYIRFVLLTCALGRSAFSLFTFHFSLFTFHFSLFTFHFSLFTFHFSLFTFHFSLFTFHFSLFTFLLTVTQSEFGHFELLLIANSILNIKSQYWYHFAP